LSIQVNDPEDVKVTKAVLKTMGVEEYEPGVIDLMLNYMYR